MESVGICIGATTLSAVRLVRNDGDVVRTAGVFVKAHNGNPREVLLEAIRLLNVGAPDRVAVTGRKFRQILNLTTITEPEAVESALGLFNGNIPGKPAGGLTGDGDRLNAVVSAGGETFLVYVIGRNGRISSVRTGNKCASGTGDFYVQQLKRMEISLADASRFFKSERPYRVSGRCSVFCKSDCTHAANKGVQKERIASGLCRMMAGKILEILRQTPKKNIMVVGGTSRNGIMVEYLREEIENLIVPEEAPYFEALGAGLWALENETLPVYDGERIFRSKDSSFSYLPPLREAMGLVEFKTAVDASPRERESCILGLDVGSTTTKAVLMRVSDSAVIASVYLRTNGDPVGASRACYADLLEKLESACCRADIVGLGVTGSGRQIAGLHAMTGGVINEIIAHAAGALYFDAGVDTIFEIGGQDAKYTYLVNGVPSDYAMNDACSAGTGSFLEESARETLGVEMEQIADEALNGGRPPNFNDQCAAFIGSDIKTAFHEGICREDIMAGLVYSIAMNYNTRVRGNRPAGNRVFMQGGVCYNRAVPAAMASLTGKPIIVPPDPGLTGAFGVALEIRKRIELDLLPSGAYSLAALRDREISYGEPFVCTGGKEKCDRKCEISRIRLENRVYPFGGACNRWYNIRAKIDIDPGEYDLASRYEALVFGMGRAAGEKTVGINKSFMMNQYYPLFHRFFASLGFIPVLPDRPEPEGADYKGAAFCYPAEISHAYFLRLLNADTDYLFLPHIKGVQAGATGGKSTACPISQAEPYFLRSAFKDHPGFAEKLSAGRVVSPVLDLSQGCEGPKPALIEAAVRMGAKRAEARKAYEEAVSSQSRVAADMKRIGASALEELSGNPAEFAVVLFGRAYNSCVSEANMGIPHKFASRGIKVIPCDFLEMGGMPDRPDMYWSSGRSILGGADLVKGHPQLFGCFITNFSCGPDSFLVGRVRSIMGKKPLLVLELDSHTADAGLETRIEAFIDIVRNYRELVKRGAVAEEAGKAAAPPARFDPSRQIFIDSAEKEFAVTDPHVHLLFPSMGRFFNHAGAAVFRSQGVRSSSLSPSDEEILKLGRGATSCKECLPLLLTTGSLIKYLRDRKSSGELLVYFMPTASGPCRFGQYSVFMNDLIEREGIENVCLFSLSAENSYTDLGFKNLTLKLWTGIVIGDIMENIYSVLLANAEDRSRAVEVFRGECDRLLQACERNLGLGQWRDLLGESAEKLRKIPVRRSLAETPFILLTGEIFVRHDDLSRQFLVERLADSGFAVKVSSMAEWIYYTDWCVKEGYSGRADLDYKKKAALRLRSWVVRRYEKALKQAVRPSGLFDYRLEDVSSIIERVDGMINRELLGEAILTVGASMSEVLEHYCGVIAIGPFGCMPNRIAEAILSREMNRDGKMNTGPKGREIMDRMGGLQEFPFLAIESDGNPFPQIINAKIETFILQASRTFRLMKENRDRTGRSSG